MILDNKNTAIAGFSISEILQVPEKFEMIAEIFRGVQIVWLKHLKSSVNIGSRCGLKTPRLQVYYNQSFNKI